MHKLVLTTVSLSAALAAQAPVGVVSPWSSATPGNNPIVNTTVINLDEAGNPILEIDQFEARHIGGGIYRCAATIGISIGGTAQPDLKLITGSLNLSGATPVWTPNADVVAFNQAGSGADEFQISLSSDGLTAVWDRYTAGTTYPASSTHGASGTVAVNATSNTWMCTRTSTSVAFAGADIRPIGGVGAGGVDPHIAEENGNIITLYHIDFVGPTPDIIKGTFDKTSTTPSVAGTTSVVATHAGTASTFSHSPTAMRDSTGKARSLVFSEYKSSGGTFSDAFFQEGVVPSAERQEILDGQGPPLFWHNNPCTIGGTFHYCTSGQSEPNLLEVTALANATLTGGGRIVAFAPVRPNGGGTFISAIGIGTPAGFGYPIPPVVGDIWIFPSLGVLDIRFHNAQTGLAEWVFGAVPPMGTLAMQVVTLDTAAGLIRAGNDAVLVL
jgi:hypothetical protein